MHVFMSHVHLHAHELAHEHNNTVVPQLVFQLTQSDDTATSTRHSSFFWQYTYLYVLNSHVPCRIARIVSLPQMCSNCNRDSVSTFHTNLRARTTRARPFVIIVDRCCGGCMRRGCSARVGDIHSAFVRICQSWLPHARTSSTLSYTH